MIVKNKDGFVQKGKLFDAIWDGAEEKKLKTVRDVLQFLHDFHTADVVPVVRCKNCNHLTEDGFCFKNINGVGGYKKPRPDDFCSYGERK